MTTRKQYEPIYDIPAFTAREQKLLAPFFTNLTESAYGITIPNEEVVGAICSRASRAAGDLREVFLREFLLPTVEPVRLDDESDKDWTEREQNAALLTALIDELQEASITERFANRKARALKIRKQFSKNFHNNSSDQKTPAGASGTTVPPYAKASTPHGAGLVLHCIVQDG